MLPTYMRTHKEMSGSEQPRALHDSHTGISRSIQPRTVCLPIPSDPSGVTRQVIFGLALRGVSPDSKMAHSRLTPLGTDYQTTASSICTRPTAETSGLVR